MTCSGESWGECCRQRGHLAEGSEGKGSFEVKHQVKVGKTEGKVG